MKAFATRTAFKFLIAQQTGRTQVSRKHNTWKSGRKKYAVDVYLPDSGRLRGTILFIHGMALLGNQDPRQIKVCSALANAGYAVVAPDYKDIRDTRIVTHTLTETKDLIRMISAKPDICPTGRIALFGPSYSGMVALVVAADPDIARFVSAVCTIGTFADVIHTSEFLMLSQDVDEYGRMIILQNFIHMAIPDCTKVETALKIRIADHWHKRQAPEVDAYLRTLNKRELRIYNDLLTSPEYRSRIFAKIAKKLKPVASAFYVLDKLDAVHGRVVLIHGSHDRVSPASESDTVHRRLQDLGKDSWLTLTPLISHGDTRIGLRDLPEIWRLLRAFARFFARVPG